VAAGYLHTVGLTRDGRVLATGHRTEGIEEMSAWRDVVAVSAGSSHTVAVLEGGRVLAAGDNSHGQCDVRGWQLTR
jgi:alpha-tubulin suppressor-like RCC1 family protein